MSKRYWLETLGCPKNKVDSEKLAGILIADGYTPAESPDSADVVVVNTCAFIEPARRESIETIESLNELRRPDARLVVTGCMAERYGDELTRSLPGIDLVAGFGQPLVSSAPVSLGKKPGPKNNAFDLLELPRPASDAPWAYVKVAEGCDRRCGFCAIPSFRGAQRSRSVRDVLAEVEVLCDRGATTPVREIVLVAQDLASYGRDRSARGPDGPPGWPIVELTRAVSELVPRTRLLYLYPSGLSDGLIEAIIDTGVPYFDLSLQHVSRRLLRSMRRPGDASQFLARIKRIRSLDPLATFRSSFILGYPGETEEDHDELLGFLEEAQLDWAGFFTFSPEAGTLAFGQADQVPAGLALERLRECAEIQDPITAARRDALVGQRREVLIDAPGVARSVHEAPEIDGIIEVPDSLDVGQLIDVEITEALGPDLVARPAQAAMSGART